MYNKFTQTLTLFIVREKSTQISCILSLVMIEFISLIGDSSAYSVFAEHTRFCGLAVNSA